MPVEYFFKIYFEILPEAVRPYHCVFWHVMSLWPVDSLTSSAAIFHDFHYIFSFIKVTNTSLFLKHPKIQLLINIAIFFLLFFFFSCQLYESLSLLLSNTDIHLHLCIQSFLSFSFILM